ncbi:MAG: VOC family protein [Actinomycetota bacterium]
MGNPVAWFEINSKNSKALHGFYAKAFGWEIDDSGGYGLVDTKADGIGGGIGEAEGPNQVTFYVAVPDLDSALKQIEQLGGKTVVPVTEVPNMVTFAQFADPEGNVVGLFKSNG